MVWQRMDWNGLVAFVVVSVLLIGGLTVGVGSAASEGTLNNSETDIVLVSLEREKDVTSIESAGGRIVHRYPDRALVKLPERAEEELGFRDIDVRNSLSRRTEISVTGYRFDITEGEPDLPEETTIDGYEKGEKGQYIVNMVGPIAPEWRSEIEDMDVEVINYLHNYAYRVWMTPEQADEIEDLDFVDRVGWYHPEYRLQSDIEPGTIDIRLVSGAEEDTIREIERIVTVISAKELREGGFTVQAEAEHQEELHELSKINEVRYISERPKIELHDEMATQIIGGGTWFYPEDWEAGDGPYRAEDLSGDLAGDAGSFMNQLGYTGDEVVIAVADTGLGDGTTPDAGHDDFTGRVIGGEGFETDGWEDTHGHGTHVAGSAAGDTFRGTQEEYPGLEDYYAAQGSAPGAELYVQKVFMDGASIPDPTIELFQEAKQSADAYVHSNSWGASLDPGDEEFGQYIWDSPQFDASVRDSDPDSEENEQMIITGSAGNDGDLGDNSVPPPATAKNAIIVGATENYNSESDDPEVIAGFSSRGFTDDNRVKPDLQAPGSSIYSTDYDGDYRYMSGTSMSNPAVAGAAAVVVEWYEDHFGEKPSPAMVRALLINTANPLDGDTRGPIPNQDEGWGMVDISKLERPQNEPISFLFEDQDHELETGEVHEHTVGVEDQNEPLKITLTWTDKEAPEETGSDTALINDLNLEVESPSGDVFHGNAFAEDGGEESTWDHTYPNTDTMSVFDDKGDGWDDTNNVQNVYIHPDDLEFGAYTINVEGFDVPEDGTNDGEQNQDYALTVYNAVEDPLLDLQRPEGGEYWEVGTEEEILWVSEEVSGEITGVDLEYSVDGGTSWDHIVQGESDTGEYIWTIPDETTQEALVRATIHDDEDGERTDTSGEFAITDITPPEVTLTSPVGEEEWHAGDQEDITWDTEEGDDTVEWVDIEYSVDGGDDWEYIVEDEDDDGEYTWDIPDETSFESQVKVTVYCAEDTADFDSSDNFDLVGFPPEPPENVDVETITQETATLFEDDVSEDKGYTTGKSREEASEWSIQTHDSSVGNQSWDWGDGEFDKIEEDGMLSWLITPEIDIPEDVDEEEGVEFTFEHWRDFGDSSQFDAGNVKISTEGVDGSYELITPEDGYNGTVPTGWDNPLGGEEAWGGEDIGWESAEFDLTAYAGEQVHIRWDAGVEAWDDLEGEGWRIDDLLIEAVIIREGKDHNLVSWDASPGDWSEEQTSSESNIDGDQEISDRSSLGVETLHDTENGITESADQPVEHEDGWHSLYGHAEDDANEVEWRYVVGNAVGYGDPSTWYVANVLDFSDQVGSEITDVAFYHTSLGTPPHLSEAIAHIGVDDDGAPAEPFLTSSELFTEEETGWIELELDDPVIIDPDEDYWVVMEYEEGGDGDFPGAYIHEDNDVENEEDAYIESAHFMSDPDADPHHPLNWDDQYGSRGAFTLEARTEPLDYPFFVVEIEDYDEEVEPGEDVTVDYTVTNIGGEEGTRDIEFFVEGTLEDSEESITLEEDQTYDDRFVWQTDEEDIGSYDLLVSSEDDEEEMSVMVGDPKEVSHYNVYRAEDEDGPWDQVIGQVEANGSKSYEYIDLDQAGEPYHWYVVRAVSEDGVEEDNENAVQEPITELDYVQIYPEDAQTIRSGEAVNFSAEAYNEYDELITDDVTEFTWENISEIDEEENVAIFSEVEAGDHEVTASYDDVTSPITNVTVEPGEVDEVMIDPEDDQEIDAGDTIDFTATAYDQNDNIVEDDDEEFTWQNADETGTFDNTTAGEYEVTASYDDVTSPITNVTVKPGEVEYIEIEPDEGFEIEAGEEEQFSAEAFDKHDNLITAEATEFTWKNATEEGVFVNTTAGEYEVTASYEGVASNVVMVTVEPDEVVLVEIDPDEDQEIVAGDTVEFSAIAYDQYDNLITEGDREFAWENATEEGIFEGITAGEYEITASYEGVDSDVVMVTVETDEVVSVEIYPEEDQVLSAGETIDFDAEAFDEYGNSITDIDTDFLWKNATEEGVFVNTTAGEYEVTASYEGVASNVVMVTVEPDEVVLVEIDPDEDQEIVAGDTVEFSAIAYDQYDNLITEGDREFAWENATEEGIFEGITAGEHEVVATYEEVTSDVVIVTVEPGESDDLAIYPEESIIDAGESETYIALLVDAHGNDVKEVTEETEWSDDVDVSSWNENVITPETAGEWTITGEYEGLTDSADLVLEPAAVYSVEIDPDEDKIITAGKTVDFEATAYDEYDNVVESEDEEFIWENADENGLFDETEAGEYEVTAEYEGEVSSAVTVSVDPAEVDFVAIGPEEDQTITSGETIDFEAEAYDEYWNLITDVDTDFTWENAAEDGLFDETEPGGYDVTASYEEVTSESVTVIVEPEEAEFELSDMRVEPEEPTAGEEAEFLIDVTNIGGVSGEYTTEFYLGEDQIGFDTVEVQPDETKTASITHTIEEPGEYEISVEGERIKVTVAEDVETYELALDIDGEGEIEVERDNETETVQGTETFEFPEGTNVTLTAIPYEGHEFDEWTDDLTRVDATTTVTMDRNYELKAEFVEEVIVEEYALSISVEGEGEVEITPDQDEYEEGTEVALEAIPDDDYEFVEWTGDHESTDEEIVLTMDEDKPITAVFEKEMVEEPYFEVEIVSYDEEVVKGEQVTIEYVVNNIGEAEGAQDIVITIDGEELVVEEGLILEAGEEHRGEFEWEAEEAGEYDIIIRSDDDDVELTEVVSVQEEEETDHWWILIVIAVLGVVLVLAWMYMEKEGPVDEEEESY